MELDEECLSGSDDDGACTIYDKNEDETVIHK
jgi:hypothetical protein